MKWWMRTEGPVTRSVNGSDLQNSVPSSGPFPPTIPPALHLSTEPYLSAWIKALSSCHYHSLRPRVFIRNFQRNRTDTHKHIHTHRHTETHSHTHYKELAYTIIEVDIPKSGVSKRRPRKVDGLASVLRPVGLRPRKSQCFRSKASVPQFEGSR